jgi:hypothetical protein
MVAWEFSRQYCTFDLVNWLWTVSTLAIDFLTDPILESFAGAPPVTCATRSLLDMKRDRKLESQHVFLVYWGISATFPQRQVEKRRQMIYRRKFLFQLLQLSKEFSLTLSSKLMCLNFSCDYRKFFKVSKGLLKFIVRQSQCRTKKVDSALPLNSPIMIDYDSSVSVKMRSAILLMALDAHNNSQSDIITANGLKRSFGGT